MEKLTAAAKAWAEQQWRKNIERQQRRLNRAKQRLNRSAQYRADEKRRNRQSLKALGLGTNVYEWPK